MGVRTFESYVWGLLADETLDVEELAFSCFVSWLVSYVFHDLEIGLGVSDQLLELVELYAVYVGVNESYNWEFGFALGVELDHPNSHLL